MLDQSILEIAIATCFSSSALATKLKADMLAPIGVSTLNRATFNENCQTTLCLDLDGDYPRRFRRNDIAQAIKVAWHKDMLIGPNGAEMPFLDHLFDCLFIAHGDQIQYRDGQVQAYARFASRIDPALLASWRMAKRVREQPFLKAHDLLRLMATQQPFFAPLAIADKPVAESHVHVGGVYNASMVLMAGLLPNDAPITSNKQPTNPALVELKRLAQGLMQADGLMPPDACTCENCPPGAKNTDQTALKDEANKPKAEDIATHIQTILKNSLGRAAFTNAPPALSWTWLAQQPETVRADNPRWLRQQIARSIVAQDLGQAWMWFLLWLWTHYQHPACDARLRMAIFYLLNGLMRIRRELIMDGQGLTRFIEYYGRPTRSAPNDAATVSAAKALFQGADDVAELKVMANKLQPKRIAAWLRQLAHATDGPQIPCVRPLPAHSVPQYRAMMERWHYCIHFSRSKAFLNAPKKVWDEARKLQNQLEQQAGWNLPEMLGNDIAGNTDSNGTPMRLIPSRWLRGLDVAGDENLTKTEIYAPALRWLREGMRSKHEREPASDGLHLSIHAGEDYAHPLSGMRHIDETVLYCEMRAGDRLGHALAIGILASDWIKDHGDMLLPVEEHLDNLVWAWHYASMMASRLSLAAQVLPLLERRIQKILPYVPWVHGGCMTMDKDRAPADKTNPVRRCASAARLQAITPEQLYQAWKLRRNCSYQLEQYENKGEIPDRQIQAALPDREKLTTRCNQEQDSPDQHCQTKPPTPAMPTYPPDVALYRQRWQWLAQQTGSNSAPNKGCDKLGTFTTVRIRLECNLHDEFTTHTASPETSLIDDSHSPQELEFFDALQDWLLDAYDQKGLMIEANPTSNVYIARLTQHADHPIFRWYPPNEDWLKPGEKHNRYGLRRGPIKVCINTDDPGIMPTTLRTEFALLREAALQHGVTRTNAESWLERLRLLGLNEFRQKHQPVWVPSSSLPD
jgi:hypothetical protein